MEETINIERDELLKKIKELEDENSILKTNNQELLTKDVEEFIAEMDSMLKISLETLKKKDEEINKLNEKLSEDNKKWKGYVKLLVDYLEKKNTLVDDMKKEIDKFFEKSKKQELINRENNNKILSYEELIHIDQQLLKQYKQIEIELNNKISNLEKENNKYSQVIKIINENSKNLMIEFKKKIDDQNLLINNLSSIVSNFRGRYLYNNIGKQNGIINKINKKSDKYENLKEMMNPLEYEFSIIWKDSQKNIVERKCELLELSLNLKNEDINYQEEEQIDLNIVSNKNKSLKETLPLSYNYIDRIIGMYDVFCKCNLLLQYFQYKALKYLGVNEVNCLINNGEMTGIIQWVCNIIIEIGFLTLLLGKIILITREYFSNMNLDENSNNIHSKISLPLQLNINNVLKWINKLFENILNDNLNQSINYEEIRELNNKLNILILDLKIDENLKDKLPICCLDSIMNINIALTIIVNINFNSIDKMKLDQLYKKSMNISEKFYSKCGCLSSNGIHYPIDDKLYNWNSLYWNNILEKTTSITFNNSFIDMLNFQKEIYNIIKNEINKQTDITHHFDKLINFTEELEINLDQLLNPINIETTSTNNCLLELFIINNLQKKIIENLDEYSDKDSESFNENNSENGNLNIKDKNIVESQDINNESRIEIENEDTFIDNEIKLFNTTLESPKKQKLETRIKILNEKIQSLKKELINKEMLCSSYNAMDSEYKKLQDHKQLLIHRIEEQEFEMKIKQEQIKKYEEIINKSKQESELLKRNLENLQNLPKIKAYSELDVLEPVYLRRLVRIMNNRLFEIEMNYWNKNIINENQNDILKLNYNQKCLINQIHFNKSFDRISKKLLENQIQDKKDDEKKIDQEKENQKINLSLDNETFENSRILCLNMNSNYIDLLTILNEFKDLKKKILLHRCSMPIYDQKFINEFKKEWENYIKIDSELKYKLHIMKRSIEHLLSTFNNNTNINNNNSNNSSKSKIIGKLSIKIPYSNSNKFINKNSNIQVNNNEWNKIIQNILNI